MKLNIKSLVMMFMATILSFSAVSCSDDDDDDNKVFSNSIGSIVDKGDQLVASAKYNYEDDGLKVTLVEEYIATFKDGKCVNVIEKDTYTPSDYAKDVYDLYCEDWEEDFEAMPTINGGTITCIIKNDNFKELSKDEVIVVFEEYLKDAELGDDEEE